MTGSDSTPDFSWLKDNAEANEPDSNAGAESDHTLGTESDEESASIDENPSSEETTGASPEEVAAPSDSILEDSPQMGEPEEEKAVDSEDDVAENSSVFDDTDEEQSDRDSDSNGPTMLMPERQIPDDPSSHLQSEFDDDDDDDDDETMVLESEGSSPSETEIFANKSSGEDSGESDTTTGEDKSEITEAVVGQTSMSENSEVSEDGSPSPMAKANDSSEKGTENSNLKFLLLASYASAMTIVVLMLLMRSGQSANPHHLESLPDVAPEPADELSYVPVKATLPPGHRLKLGEKQRFGNIEVEPLKIVKEPLEFTHYSGNGDLKRPATDPVYKLWLKFTNVSDKQEIAPLDGELLLRWVRNSDKQREYANYYIFEDGADSDEDVIETYRHSTTSDWDLQNQQLGHVLEPGESYETYIPSMEGLSRDLPENANWRLQFRKGYSPDGNGVTTIIDVAFHNEDVETSS